MNEYAKQDRGELSEYEEYFAGMDASMQQKIALTTAHFPTSGRVADMGSGSGSGTFDLARLYRGLELVGVDINPVTVEYSRGHYKAENLRYETGDIADMVFPPESLDGILDSSVLHHVTSFNGFDNSQIARTLRNQVTQLRSGGVLIIRDFVVPDESEKTVFIDLPTTDGENAGSIPELSSAALFEVFARDFRSSRNSDEPVAHRRVESSRAGFARFETSLKSAAEFVLRKDYRDHWTPELLEEYCYYSQREFEENFRRENLRIVVSMPLWNPWIVENRFRGKFHITEQSGKPVVFPPTNFLIVGEKVAPGEGVRLAETASESIAQPSFLKLKAYRDRASGRIFELAERPHRTIDLLPWYESAGGQLMVVAKKDFPRPVVNAGSATPNLNRANYSGYITEPLSAIAPGNGMPDELRAAAMTLLDQRASISAEDVRTFSKPDYYYTSPGGVDERVEAFLVELKPQERPPVEIENYTDFRSAGSVRELDALQVLRSSHVGGMFDARLEINIYRLLRFLGRGASSWIGAAIEPETQTSSIQPAIQIQSIAHAAFEETTIDAPAFLDVTRGVFAEYDSADREISVAEFEYVVPKLLGKSTAAAIPFIKTADAVLVGLEFRDLPAPQNFTGSSRLLCAPAWRLSREISHKFDIEEFLAARLPIDFNASVLKIWELGGSYFASSGVTPEIVYPFAVEIDEASANNSELTFYDLEKLLRQTDEIHDAHLLILLNRLGHALGLV